MRPIKELLAGQAFKQTLQKSLLVTSIALLAACGSDDDAAVVVPVPHEGFTISADVTAEFRADLTYGTDTRNVFDIFLPQSETPTPLVIYVHGGGFYAGDKSAAYGDTRNADINEMLEAGVAFATVNYSLLSVPGITPGVTVNDTDGIMKPLSDVKEALQYIRLNAADFNVDPDNIAMYGTSAGASASLWLGLSDDMADVNAEQGSLASVSTRISAIGAIETQGSLDIVRWETEILLGILPPGVFPASTTLDGGNVTLAFASALSLPLMESFFALPAADAATSLPLIFGDPDISDLRDSLDFLDLMDASDPAMFVQNTLESQGALITDLTTLFTAQSLSAQFEAAAENPTNGDLSVAAGFAAQLGAGNYAVEGPAAGAAIIGAFFHYPTHAKLLYDNAISASIDVEANIPNLVAGDFTTPAPIETTVGLTVAEFLLDQITP
jgi:poly(3-hydroxybutyrate) depolymerase